MVVVGIVVASANVGERWAPDTATPLTMSPLDAYSYGYDKDHNKQLNTDFAAFGTQNPLLRHQTHGCMIISLTSFCRC